MGEVTLTKTQKEKLEKIKKAYTLTGKSKAVKDSVFKANTDAAKKKLKKRIESGYFDGTLRSAHRILLNKTAGEDIASKRGKELSKAIDKSKKKFRKRTEKAFDEEGKLPIYRQLRKAENRDIRKTARDTFAETKRKEMLRKKREAAKKKKSKKK